MTLSQAALGVSEETATSTASLPPIDRFYLEPRCRVCRNDVLRKMVNDLLASGASYASTLRALGGEAVGVTTDSVRRHAERHFPVQNVAKATYREILERRAKENSVDFVEGVATAITPMAFLETVMVKGYENLVDERTTVSYRDGVAAAVKLTEALRTEEPEIEMARMHAEIGRIIEIVRTFIPSERWPEIQAMLSGDVPIHDHKRPSQVESVRMVDIDDMPDEDAY
jgi:hypothetical protein